MNKDINYLYFINNLKIPNLKKDPLRYCLQNNLINKNGLWLEFGVSSGGTIDLISNYNENNIYGFDLFDSVDKIGNWKDLYNECQVGIPKNVNELNKNNYGRTGVIKKINKNVKFVKGYFEETVNEFLSTKKSKITFIHIDCTFYESTKTVLTECLPYIDDAIIIFNSLINTKNYFNNELLAFYNFIHNNNKFTYEFIGKNGNKIITDLDELNKYIQLKKNNFGRSNNGEYDNIYCCAVAIHVKRINLLGNILDKQNILH